MVIIAFTFTVIPKLIQVSNKTLEFSKKEDAIFNMMSKMMDISLKEYDYNNTLYDDILLTGNNNILECNTSTSYRIGGFKGSRNCINDINESSIPNNSGDEEYDYIEGYNGYSDTLTSGHTTYDLNVTVGYTDEWNSSYYNDTALDFNFTNRSDNTKSNIKRIGIIIATNDRNISFIKYYSANIGHVKIGSVLW